MEVAINFDKIGQNKIEYSLTYVMWLSELLWTVSKLTELLEWTIASGQPVLAHLSLILLSPREKLLGLITIEIVIVRLLSQLSHHLALALVSGLAA